MVLATGDSRLTWGVFGKVRDRWRIVRGPVFFCW